MNRSIDVKNINKDYLVTVNAKTAAIKAPKDMKFHITDVLTCNVFFKLEFKDPNDVLITDLINNHAPKEDASNYKLTLRVVKPNNEPKEVIAELLDQNSDFFIADLTTDFTDILGFYECELFIETEINGRKEINTTESFKYEVEKSIFSNLDEVIEGDPNYPSIIDSLATKDYVKWAMENMDLFGYATRDYVNQILIGGDLSGYVTDEELAEALSNLDVNLDLSDYVTEQELDDKLANISNGGTVDLSSYATKQEVNESLANKADNEHTHEEYVTNEELINKDYATKDQIPASLPADGGNANTVNGYSIWVGTEDEYYALEEIVPNMLYFIKEDE